MTVSHLPERRRGVNPFTFFNPFPALMTPYDVNDEVFPIRQRDVAGRFARILTVRLEKPSSRK